MQAITSSFQPRGGAASTNNIAVTAAAQSMPLPIIAVEGVTVRLVNAGTQTVFIAFAGTATVATSMPMLANTIETFTFPQGAVISVIAAGTGSTLYATFGDGQ
jgi:hypothetical protein